MGQALVPAFDYMAEVVEDTSASVNMALDRVRQLSAHEVGHTLGFPHNYLASAYGRESVMDYPAPLIEITDDGRIDLSNAYVQRIGEYDKLAVRYAYSQFGPDADEAAELAAIVQESLDTGLIFMAHNNNNFRGAGHQFAGVWDNGENLVDHLKHEIEVRRIGLENFSEKVIRRGTPISELEWALLPLYMHHRFQLNSAAQSLGGADYRYAVRGDGQLPFTIVEADEQRDALETVLSTLTPEFLAIDPKILQMLPPPAYRYDTGEAFPARTQQLFDPLAAAEASANLSVEALLHPARMARLVAYGSLGDYPDLEEVVGRLVAFTWDAEQAPDSYHRQIQQISQRAVVDEMMRQAASDENSNAVKSVLANRLDRLAAALEDGSSRTAHEYATAADIRRWQANPAAHSPAKPLAMPPGDPI